MDLLTKGNTAEIYKFGEKRICKLFYPGYPKDYIKHEFQNANMSKALGINTPTAYEVILYDGREGIVYERIIGTELSGELKRSGETSSAIWMDKFAVFHKQLLKHELKDAMNYKDFLKIFVRDEETIAKIDGLADGNSFIHGDFHLGNVMVDENGEFVLIDMMNVCKGSALYDIARTYFLLGYDAKLQKEYIKRMGCTLESISPYLEVIAIVRENEMKL